MPSFDFITNEEFRNSLEEDFKELVKVAKDAGATGFKEKISVKPAVKAVKV